MRISSPAFNDQDNIPSKFTCDAQNISPALTFENIPSEAKSLVLIVDDPDAPAGIWDHWLLYNIPATTNGLNDGETFFPEGTSVGKNSWGNTSYGGPCPPSGTHRYYFKLYALDTKLNFESAPNKKQLEQAMAGHVVAEASLMGRYTRQ